VQTGSPGDGGTTGASGSVRGEPVMGRDSHHLDFALRLLCPPSNTSAGAILSPRFTISLRGETARKASAGSRGFLFCVSVEYDGQGT
jgi:hypothetical protein